MVGLDQSNQLVLLLPLPLLLALPLMLPVVPSQRDPDQLHLVPPRCRRPLFYIACNKLGTSRYAARSNACFGATLHRH